MKDIAELGSAIAQDITRELVPHAQKDIMGSLSHN